MSCKRNAILANKISYVPLDEQAEEITLAVTKELEDCVLINTKNYIAFDGTTVPPVYSRFGVPDDMLQCLPSNCRNTGTLTVIGGVGSEVGVTFRERFDASEYVVGVVAVYFTFPAAGTYTVGIQVADITQDVNLSFVNFDEFTKQITVDSAKTIPITFRLEDPTNVEGTGWDETTGGINLRVFNTPTEATNIGRLDISSISLLTSIEALELEDVIVVGCVEDNTGDVTFDITDSSCFGARYDSSTLTIERTFTGGKVTGNYHKSNPLENEGHLETAPRMENRKLTVKPTTVDGIEFGFVQVPDINLNECSFVFVQLADNCNVVDSILDRNRNPQATAIEENKFIVLDPQMSGVTEIGKIIVNENLVGQELIVRFPREVKARHYVANLSAMHERHVTLTYEKQLATPDGKGTGIFEIFVFRNVFVTSFPQTITGEGKTFPFTVRIERDENGNFYDRFVTQ